MRHSSSCDGVQISWLSTGWEGNTTDISWETSVVAYVIVFKQNRAKENSFQVIELGFTPPFHLKYGMEQKLLAVLSYLH